MRSATGTGCAAERCDEEARSGGYCHTHHYYQDEIVAHDVDGKIIHRRPPTATELAMREHGPLERTPEWRYHPACHNPPERFGACVMRFADGNYWCFGCEVAWGL